ncbi:MAG: helix-turn-helix domain-containing protein, partial [Oscillospiraceae bacterium]|nr:helix-turn-helix domain-containing protein [Oscillospiraceae bacterium]
MPVRCSVQHIGTVELHLHDYFEIIFILSGECRITVDGQLHTLGSEDIIAINGHVPHELHSAECDLVSVQFEQSLFEQTLPEPQHPDFLCNSAIQGDSAAFEAIRRLIARLVKNNADRQLGFELRNWSLVYELMDVMYNNFRGDAGTTATKSYRYAARVAQITSLINAHYTENFSLSQLAAEVHLSAPYLSKFFEQHFGMGFLAYLTKLRLSHALDALERTEDTIEAISADSGFPNSYAFVQAFKKEYGILPSVYRRQYRANQKSNSPSPIPAVVQHDYMTGLRKYLEEPQINVRPEQVITCSARFSANANLQSLRHTWQTLTGVSSAKDLLLADVQNMVRRAQKDIGFSYIKFGGIFSDELRVYSQDSDGKPVYNFAYIDKVFDFLLGAGLRPLIQLGFMPRLLAKETQHLLFNSLISEPRHNEEWAALVAAFTRHILDRYGEAEVKNWLFSVWQQPDTPHTLYGFSDDHIFYEFYRITWQTIKHCCPDLQVGTPPTFYIARPEYVNWYRPFLRWCRENGCMPDFLNFNFYDTSLSDGHGGQKFFGFVESMTLGEDPNGLKNFVTQAVSEAHQEQVKDLPIYLSEWNNSPSQQDWLNDTCYKSCYIVKSILENYDRIDSFGYWSLTDFMGEAPLPPELFFGGNGLFTVNGVPKAGFYSFTLLRQLGNILVGRG